MIFVDTNVWMYAVGRQHPLRAEARGLIHQWVEGQVRVATSAEVLQELLHAYLPVGRGSTLAAAMRLATDVAEVWPTTGDDVVLAAQLSGRHEGVSARDLVHVASCLLHGADELVTFDRGLQATFKAVVG